MEKNPLVNIVLRLPADELQEWRKTFRMKNRLLNCRLVSSSEPYYLHVLVKLNGDDVLLRIPHNYVSAILEGAFSKDTFVGFLPAGK